MKLFGGNSCIIALELTPGKKGLELADLNWDGLGPLGVEAVFGGYLGTKVPALALRISSSE
jgi:hypothetical protein